MPRETSKCLFTLPVRLIDELNESLSNTRGSGFAQVLPRDSRRFSRDRFLSDQLEAELDRIEHAKELVPNSSEGQKVLQERHRDTLREVVHRQINLNLSTSAVERLNTVCRSTGIPRDLFMGLFLELLIRGLRQALEVAKSPTLVEWDRREQSGEAHPYECLSLSEDEVDEHRSEIPVIDALAKLTKASFGVAREAYRRLPAVERKQVRNSAEVRRVMKELADAQSLNQMNLDKYLSPEQRRRARAARGHSASRRK